MGIRRRSDAGRVALWAVLLVPVLVFLLAVVWLARQHGGPGATSTAAAPSAAPAPAPTAPAADAKPKAKKGSHTGFKSGPEFGPQPGETQEQKIARLKRLVEEAKRAAGKL